MEQERNVDKIIVLPLVSTLIDSTLEDRITYVAVLENHHGIECRS